MPGIGELVIILVIILIVFGAGKLPQIGDALGRSIRNFKRASTGKEEKEVSPEAKEIEAKEEKPAIEEGKSSKQPEPSETAAAPAEKVEEKR